MFLLPLGLLCGADASVADAVARNLLPVTLGNYAGAQLLVRALAPVAAAEAEAEAALAAAVTQKERPPPLAPLK